MAAETVDGSLVSVISAEIQPSRSWDVACEHGVEPLKQRIALKHLRALEPSEENTPIFRSENFRTTRACFVPRCFRAVIDDFATAAETDELWRGLEPAYGRPSDGTASSSAESLDGHRGKPSSLLASKSRQDYKSGEHFIGITAGMFPAGLLANITDRMATYLRAEHGAVQEKESRTRPGHGSTLTGLAY